MSSEDLSTKIIIQTLETHVVTLYDAKKEIAKENSDLKDSIASLHQFIDEILQNNTKSDEKDSVKDAYVAEQRKINEDLEKEFSRTMDWFYQERNENDNLKRELKEVNRINFHLKALLEEQNSQNAILLNQLKSLKFNQIFSSTSC
jgi:hypothetical protein